MHAREEVEHRAACKDDVVGGGCDPPPPSLDNKCEHPAWCVLWRVEERSNELCRPSCRVCLNGALLTCLIAFSWCKHDIYHLICWGGSDAGTALLERISRRFSPIPRAVGVAGSVLSCEDSFVLISSILQPNASFIPGLSSHANKTTCRVNLRVGEWVRSTPTVPQRLNVSDRQFSLFRDRTSPSVHVHTRPGLTIIKIFI